MNELEKNVMMIMGYEEYIKTRADDMALGWISTHTKIEIDSKAYRELVKLFITMARIGEAKE